MRALPVCWAHAVIIKARFSLFHFTATQTVHLEEAALKAADIRQKFLQFFAAKNHTVVRSSSLVPGNDPTLLFTNSGMVQFKDVFLGTEQRNYTRATTAQRSVRAGGKHNDLENVGYTARHHTFFEMLGNFSFGDYFKRDAIHYAWELLTTVYSLPKEKLWVTVYQDDDEAYAIWQNEIGVPVERIVRIGDNKGARYASDNFWQMADTGPCGPSSEIFYDHGAEVAGGPPGSPDAEGDRYIEIWNLVFMQFNKDEAGVLHPLPKPCVDTGMGLERLAAVLQGVHSNYEIDLFQHLIRAAARETGCADVHHHSLKVIADHIRACSFLIVDGVIPGSAGRGYVLRRIMRRALRHGYKLGKTQPFLHQLVPDLVAEMGAAYPELAQVAARVAAVIQAEEEQFGRTLENGMKILEAALANDNNKSGTLDGETIFTLYDTYGFPSDLSADIARERGQHADLEGFERAMQRQREQARASGKFKMAANVDYSGVKTAFQGYETLQWEGKITALYVGGSAFEQVLEGQEAVVVLDGTPFYAESGGQVGDVGELSVLTDPSSKKIDGTLGGTFRVDDTQKIQPDVFGHVGVVQQGSLALGDVVQARVNLAARQRTANNHSATHLLHAALRQVLGAHVQQKGSLVDADKTRFDFAHDHALSDAQIQQIESLVNAQIRANHEVSVRHMAYDAALQAGAMALFGEKYGDQVRVLGMGSFSTELCGGTHVQRTGDIGLFKIVSESGVAAGIRRVEAVTGEGAVAYVQHTEAVLHSAAARLKTSPAELNQRLGQMTEQLKALEKELARLKSKVAASQGDELLAQARDIKGVKVLAARLEGADANTLRDTLDQLKNKLKNAAIVLAAIDGEKVSLIAGVTPELTAKLKAGELVNHVAQQVGGKGGGRADMAQAGGTQPAQLPSALASVAAWIEARL